MKKSFLITLSTLFLLWPATAFGQDNRTSPASEQLKAIKSSVSVNQMQLAHFQLSMTHLKQALENKEAAMVIKVALEYASRDFNRYWDCYQLTAETITTFVDSLWSDRELSATDHEKLTLEALTLVNQLMPQHQLDPDKLMEKAGQVLQKEANKRKVI